MITFLEKEHLYLIDGILVKSVTQILELIFPNKYKNVNKKILAIKAHFGTTGHKIIEDLDVNISEEAFNNVLNGHTTALKCCIKEYIRLVKKFKIEPLEHEKKISYKHLYAGTLDMIALVDGKKSLIDVKFTAQLDKNYLSWQLGMYSLASNEKFEKYYCIWLKKGKLGELVEINPKTESEILNKLKELKISDM